MWEIYRCVKFWLWRQRTHARTYCRGGGGEAGKRLGTGVFVQFSAVGNCVEALHLATRVFVAGNHISDEQRDREQERAREKRRRNLINLTEKNAREKSRKEEKRKITLTPHPSLTYPTPKFTYLRFMVYGLGFIYRAYHKVSWRFRILSLEWDRTSAC